MYVCIVQINMDTYIRMCIHNACMHVYVHTCVCILENSEGRSNEDSVALILDKACWYFMGMWANRFQ